MPKNNLLPSEWLKDFKNAILQRDIEAVTLFLESLPNFETPDQMHECLTLTMDAEALLCDIQCMLEKKRQAIKTKFSL